MFHAVARLAAFAAAALISTAPGAATTSFTGAIDAANPAMGVVTISGNACTTQGSFQVHYQAYPFTVGTTGSHTITLAKPAGGAQMSLYVYANAFNPASGAANCIAASNTATTNLPLNLAAGTNYWLVVFDDTFAQSGGSFWASITGPGSVTATGPCAGFNDVTLADSFCSNVQWVRNRGVTSGCGGGAYCPSSNVTRGQMAAFMNRLANALEPQFLHATQAAASAVMNAGDVMCVTSDYTVVGYPRIATVPSVMVYHGGATGVPLNTRIVYSLDGGGTWQSMGTFVAITSNPPGQNSTHSPASGPLVVLPAQVVRFGIRPSVSGTVTTAGCEFLVRLDSHTGSISPFDVAGVEDTPVRPSAP